MEMPSKADEDERKDERYSMKELKRTETITKEITYGYAANDGTFFSSEEECKKYEASAKGVCSEAAKKYMIGSCSEMEFTEYGSDECSMEFFDVPDMEAAKTIAQYVLIRTNDEKLVQKVIDRIGKRLFLSWNYDMDFCWILSVDEYKDMLEKNYERFTKKEDKA